MNKVYDFLIDGATQNHLDDIHGLPVGDAHSLMKLALDIELFEQVANLWTAAVNHDGVNANQFHHHDVGGETGFQSSIGHGITAIFDYNGLASKFLDVGQRFRQNRSERFSLLDT